MASEYIRNILSILDSIQHENFRKLQIKLEQTRFEIVKGTNPIRIRTKASKLNDLSSKTITVGTRMYSRSVPKKRRTLNVL